MERLKHSPGIARADHTSQQFSEHEARRDNETWTDQSSFYPISALQYPVAFESQLGSSVYSSDSSKAWWRESAASSSLGPTTPLSTGHGGLTDLLSPGLPPRETRYVDMGLRNPFADEGPFRNPEERGSYYKLANVKAANGYVKFTLLRENNPRQQQQTRSDAGLPLSSSAPLGMPVPYRRKWRETPSPREKIAYMPRDFGNVSRLDEVDRKLLKFYTVAYCQGRTILPNGNYWYNEFPSIADEDDATMHSLLTLAGAYVLDYRPSEVLLRRVNEHYQRASECIDRRLKQPETHDVGKGEAIISAIVTVNWELRKSNGEEPHWLRGAYLAKSILDHTDPGFRYYKIENVQCSKARASNGNIVAQTCILAQVMLPLRADEDYGSFLWLLEGTASETRRIRSTGLCPKLLHMFYQITCLCARLKHNPQSETLPQLGEEFLKKLDNFHQWSELSQGYRTTAELFASCDPNPDTKQQHGDGDGDGDGKVNDKAKVVELTAESWVWCAKIYLQCRFFRKPFTHPDVRHSLEVLRRCLLLLPFEGVLFTSQFPFFAVALASLLACSEEDRVLPRVWFKGLVAEASCRSSVPPVWDAIQKMWEWMDTSFAGLYEEYDEKQIVGERRDWWEEMVTWLLENFGYMHLA